MLLPSSLFNTLYLSLITFYFLRLPIHVFDPSGLFHTASTTSHRLQTRLQTPDVSSLTCDTYPLALASLYCLGHMHTFSSQPFQTMFRSTLAYSRLCLSSPFILFNPFV